MKAIITCILLIMSMMLYAQAYEFTATYINKPLAQDTSIWGDWQPVTSDITVTYTEGEEISIHTYNASSSTSINKKFLIGKIIDNEATDHRCFTFRAVDISRYDSVTVELDVPIDDTTGTVITIRYDSRLDDGDNLTDLHAYALALVPKIIDYQQAVDTVNLDTGIDILDGLVYKSGSDSPFTGVGVNYYGSGEKFSQGNYKEGQLEGIWTSWYGNGRKIAEGNYKDGKEEGLWIGWYDNGQKMFEGKFKNGKKVSLIEWDKNGNKKKK